MSRLRPLRIRSAAAIVLGVVAACAAPSRPVEAPAALVVGRTPAGASTLDVAPPDAPRTTCPIVPLTLVIAAGDPAQELVVLTLDARGDLLPAAGFGMSKRGGLGEGALGHLEPNGCVMDEAGATIADASTPAQIWTPLASHEVDGARGDLKIGATGRSMHVASDGAVQWIDGEGKSEPFVAGVGFVFRGYGPGAECAARVVLVSFFAMMPSMAVSDGHPQHVPPPEGSRCVHH